MTLGDLEADTRKVGGNGRQNLIRWNWKKPTAYNQYMCVPGSFSSCRTCVSGAGGCCWSWLS